MEHGVGEQGGEGVGHGGEEGGRGDGGGVNQANSSLGDGEEELEQGAIGRIRGEEDYSGGMPFLRANRTPTSKPGKCSLNVTCDCIRPPPVSTSPMWAAQRGYC